jgi:hypothetical protein
VADWRVAECLVILRAEADAVAPERDRTYDGTLGDAAHAARASRHNPNAHGVVCARDITHDPEHGMDVRSLFTFLCAHPHPELAYIITNGQTASKAGGWKPKKYGGADMHLRHIHIAVGTGPDSNAQPPYDSTETWHLAEWKGTEDDMDEATVRAIVRSEIEQVLDPKVTKEAEAFLMAEGILSKSHPASKAASIGYLNRALQNTIKKLRPAP